MAADIDKLIPTRSLIDLSSNSAGDFGLDDFKLSFVFDDIVLVEYIDLTAQKEIIRNGLVLPASMLQKAWRKARVILAGPLAKYTKVGDIVVFPSNLGVTVANMEIESYGKIKEGVFLNESRIFGICKPLTDGNSSDTVS